MVISFLRGSLPFLRDGVVAYDEDIPAAHQFLHGPVVVPKPRLRTENPPRASKPRPAAPATTMAQPARQCVVSQESGCQAPISSQCPGLESSTSRILPSKSSIT